MTPARRLPGSGAGRRADVGNEPCMEVYLGRWQTHGASFLLSGAWGSVPGWDKKMALVMVPCRQGVPFPKATGLASAFGGGRPGGCH